MARDWETFPRAAEKRAARRRRARRERENVWFGLGMFGLVGWSVAIPTLGGIAVGLMLDGRASQPGISWTLTGLGVGLALGCAIAWYWVRQETRRHERSRDDADTGPASDERPGGSRAAGGRAAGGRDG